MDNRNTEGMSMRSAWLVARSSGDFAHAGCLFQFSKLENYCVAQSIEVAGTTELSADMPIDFQSIMDGIRISGASMLIATAISRLTQDLDLLRSVAKEYADAGIELHTLTEGNICEFFSTFDPMLRLCAKAGATVEDDDIIEEDCDKAALKQRIRERFRKKAEGGKENEKACKHPANLEN